MVDVSNKKITHRVAQASAQVRMSEQCGRLLRDNSVPKGNVVQTATLAGIMAAKKTSSLIPLSHNIPLEYVQVEINLTSDLQNGVIAEILSEVRTTAKTGVEMEAMTAVCVAALTLYDMLKSVDKRISIGSVHLYKKTGGKSGTWLRADES